MLLALDIGNTSITCGVYKDDTLFKTFRMESKRHSTLAENEKVFNRMLMMQGITASDITGAITASVVPELTAIFHRMFKKIFSVPLIGVGQHCKTGITVDIEKPQELGADRLVNAVSAYNKYSCSLIIVDFGTATTFDCISHEGAYIGGVIIPGPEICSRALAEYTALLPRIEIAVPKTVIGRNTKNCIESGIFYGYTGMVREIIKQIKKSMGAQTLIIATGGYASFWMSELPEIKENLPFLTLDGLYLLWQMNK